MGMCWDSMGGNSYMILFHSVCMCVCVCARVFVRSHAYVRACINVDSKRKVMIYRSRMYMMCKTVVDQS
jgi:hypothetical protein